MNIQPQITQMAQIIIVGLNKITQIATRMPQSERFVEDPREPAVNPIEFGVILHRRVRPFHE